MKLHQVITGSRNRGRNSLAYLNHGGSTYIVYGSGDRVVILDQYLYQKQLFADVFANGTDITCVACEDTTCLIAVSDGKRIAILETVDSPNENPVWRMTCQFDVRTRVATLAWFPHATPFHNPVLLIGSVPGKPPYQITALEIPWPNPDARAPNKHFLRIKLTGVPKKVAVSPDGRFIATIVNQGPSCCKLDVRGWTPAGWQQCGISDLADVVDFSWRRMPAFIPPSWVPNALLTMSGDGVGRIYLEGTKGDSQDSTPVDSPISSRPLPPLLLRHPILQHFFRLWLSLPQGRGFLPPHHPIFRPDVASAASMTFFLARTINASEADRFAPSAPGREQKHHPKEAYSLQWLNNKDLMIERRFNEELQKIVLRIASGPIGDSIESEYAWRRFHKEIVELDHLMQRSIDWWRQMADYILMLDPSSGRLFVWTFEGLDTTRVPTRLLGRPWLPPDARPYPDLLWPASHSPSRVAKVVQVDQTMLPPRLPDHVSGRAVRDPLFLAVVHIRGEGELPRPAHLDLVALLVVRSKLAAAVAEEMKRKRRKKRGGGGVGGGEGGGGGVDEKSLYCAQIRDIQLACLPGASGTMCGHVVVNLYTAALDSQRFGELSHLSLGSDTVTKTEKPMEVTSTIQSTTKQANGHSSAIVQMTHHPTLPLALTLSVNEVIFWRLPLTSPSPLASTFTPALEQLGRFKVDGATTAAFFPNRVEDSVCLLAVDCILGVTLLAVNSVTEGIDQVAVLPESYRQEAYGGDCLLIVVLAGESGALLVVRVTSGRDAGCRVETWRCVVGDDVDTARCQKVGDELLPMESGVRVESMRAGPKPLSWSNKNLRPSYYFVTSCSDGGVRLWTLDVADSSTSDSPVKWSELQLSCSATTVGRLYAPSRVFVARCLAQSNGAYFPSVSSAACLLSPGDPAASSSSGVFAVACAANWRVAIGCLPHEPEAPLMIAVFECESTGGLEWILEDIVIPSDDLTASNLTDDEIQSCQLDWVNTADGGAMLLSFCCRRRLYIFAAQCLDIVAATRSSQLCTSSTLLTSLGEVGLHWSCLRCVDLSVDSDLRPMCPLLWLPNGLLALHHASHLYLLSQWPSLGKQEQQQQSDPPALPSSEPEVEVSTASTQEDEAPPNQPAKRAETADTAFSSQGAARLKSTYSSLSLTGLTGHTHAKTRFTTHLKTDSASTTKTDFTDESVIATVDRDFFNSLGLFEAAQLANPVLPQFHPRQLLEWMNLGRFRLVQALLVHLTRCLAALDIVCEGVKRDVKDSAAKRLRKRQRTVSFSMDATVEIPSPSTPAGTEPPMPELEIPPLPLYILLSLDSLKCSPSFSAAAATVSESSPSADDPFSTLHLDGRDLLSADNEYVITFSDTEDNKETTTTTTTTTKNGSTRVDASGVDWEEVESSLKALGYLASDGDVPGGVCTPTTPIWDPEDHATLLALLKFGAREAKILSTMLYKYRLPGLSRLDQMYLLGIAELMSNTHMEVADRLSGISAASVRQLTLSFDANEGDVGTGGASTAGINGAPASELELDDCGLRFVTIMQLYSYLCNTLPQAKRNAMMKEGLTSRSFVWAFHSEADETLLTFLPSQKQQDQQQQQPLSQLLSSDGSGGGDGGGNGLTWSEFRCYGCGWWIHSDSLLMRCAEKMARVEFMRTKEPMDAAIFYLAMNKPTVLAGLFKSQGNRELEAFFRSDFSPGSKARSIAKTNAYRLLGQHRYVHAAAVFIIAGMLDDAVKVCVDTLKDLQLAVVVCRLYTMSRPETMASGVLPYHQLLRTHVVNHEDPYLRSIAHWVLMQPLNAIATLLQKPSPTSGGEQTPQSTDVNLLEDLEMPAVCPSVFRLYTHLRSHPLVLRHLKLLPAQLSRRLSLVDRRLYYRTAYHYNTIGCPALALEVLNRMPDITVETIPQSNRQPVEEKRKAEEPITFSLFDNDFDPRSVVEKLEFKLTLGGEEGEEEGENSYKAGGSSDIDECDGFEYQPPVELTNSKIPENCGLDARNLTIQLQMKYWACLRICTEEIASLFRTGSSEGSRLRKLLFAWIQHEAGILQNVCSPSSGDDSTAEEATANGYHESPEVTGQAALIPIDRVHSKDGFEGFVYAASASSAGEDAAVREAQRRKKFHSCLLNNPEFLQNLITFCSLHGESGVDLRVVRMELSQLVTDAFSSVDSGDAVTQNDARALLTSTLPLLRRMELTVPPAAPFNDAICRPLEILKTYIAEIYGCLVQMPPPYTHFVRLLNDPQLETSCVPTSLPDLPLAQQQALVRQVALLRNLCAALSACVFQSLSTDDWRRHLQGNAGVAISLGGSENAGEHFAKLSKPLLPNSAPSEWPGLPGLLSPLGQQHQQPSAVVGVLAEALVCVYLGLLCCALHSRDASALYRLAVCRLDSRRTWARVFGGVARLLRRPPPPPPKVKPPRPAAQPTNQQPQRGGIGVPPPLLPPISSPSSGKAFGLLKGLVRKFPWKSASRDRGIMGLGDLLRSRFRFRGRKSEESSAAEPSTEVGGSKSHSGERTGQSQSDEWFLPPQCSIITCLLEKPRAEKTSTDSGSYPVMDIGYDSDDSSVPPGYLDYDELLRRHANLQLRIQRCLQQRQLLDQQKVEKPKEEVKEESDKDEEEDDDDDDSFDTVLLAFSDLRTLHRDRDFTALGFANALANSTAGVPTAAGQFEGDTDEDDLDERRLFAQPPLADRQWSQGSSRAWRIMRLALTRLAMKQIANLRKMLNLQLDYVISHAPFLMQAQNLVMRWAWTYDESLGIDNDGTGVQCDLGLDLTQAPEMPQSGANAVDSAAKAKARLAYLLQPNRSPFQTRNPFSLPVKRLWFTLLSNPELERVFLTWVFQPRCTKRPSLPSIELEVAGTLEDQENEEMEAAAVATRRVSGESAAHLPPLSPRVKLSPRPRRPLPGSSRYMRSRETSQAVLSEASRGNSSSPAGLQNEFSINLVHRELEPLLCMCLEKTTQQYVTVATPKELLEIRVTNLLEPADWLFDEFAYELECLRNPLPKHRRGSSTSSSSSLNDFVIFERFTEATEADSNESSSRKTNSQIFRSLLNAPTANLSERLLEFAQRAAPTMLKRNVSGVQKLAAHPLKPYYLCGTATGFVHVLEWLREEPVAHMWTNTYTLTPQGSAAHTLSSGTRGGPVSALAVDESGKRLGVGDSTGYFGLWNLDFNASQHFPYFRTRCHAKGVLDFAFLEGGSTTFVTAGTGAGSFTTNQTTSPRSPLSQSALEAANLILWDSLLPGPSAAVMAFSDAPLDAPCTCVIPIPGGEPQIAVGTKRGDIAVLDFRRPATASATTSPIHLISSAHNVVRCLSCDPLTDTLTSAGADGLVKVWRLSDPATHLLTSFRSDVVNPALGGGGGGGGGGSGSHGNRTATAAQIAAAALFRGNQSAAMVAASRPGISQLIGLPASWGRERSGVEVEELGVVEPPPLHLLTSRFLACGVDGCLQVCSVTPQPTPLWK